MIPLMMASLLFCGQDPEPESKPKGPAPVLVKITGKVDAVMAMVPQVQMMTVTKAVVEEKDGMKITKYVKEQVPQTINSYVSFQLTGAKGQMANGKKLDAEGVAKAMEKAQVIAISVDGKPVDPAYLKLLKPDTLIIEASRSGGLRPEVMPVPLPGPVPAPAIPKAAPAPRG